MQQKTLGDLTRFRKQCEFAQQAMSVAIGQKAAIGSINTGDIALRTDMAVFEEGLARATVLDRSSDAMRQAAPDVPISALNDSGPAASWKTDGGMGPLARGSYATSRTSATELIALVAESKEAIRFGDPAAEQRFYQALVNTFSHAQDAAFLGTSAATSAQPAGILHGISASASLTSPDDAQPGLERLFADVRNGDSFAPFFVTSARGALDLAGTSAQAFRNASIVGGSIAGAPLLISRAAGNRLILFDATCFAFYDGGIQIARSENAAVQMTDAPTNGAASVVSAFQVGMVVLRVLRIVNWLKLKDDAAGYIELDFDSSPA